MQPSSQYYGPRREANVPYEEMECDNLEDEPQVVAIIPSYAQSSSRVGESMGPPHNPVKGPPRPAVPQPMGLSKTREPGPEGRATGENNTPTLSKIVKLGVGRGNPPSPALGRGQVLQQPKAVLEAMHPTPVVSQPQASTSQSSRWYEDSEYSPDREQFPTVEEARGRPYNRSSFRGQKYERGHSRDPSNHSGKVAGVKKAPKRKFEGVRKGLPLEGSSLYLEAYHKALQLNIQVGERFNLRDPPTRVVAIRNSDESYVIFGAPWSHFLTMRPTKERLLPHDRDAYVAPCHPIALVRDTESLRDKSTILITVDRNSRHAKFDDEVFNHSFLFGTCTLSKADHADSCYCTSEIFSRAMPAIVSPVCLLSKISYADALSVPDTDGCFGINVTKVLKRTYLPVGKRYEYEAVVPLPFLSNMAWRIRNFRPAFSNESQSKAIIKFFYACADPRYAREISNVYRTSPDKWDPENHPHHGEPAEDSELHAHSKNLYGSESLPRVQFSGSHSMFSFHLSMAALTDDLVAEEVHTKTPHDLEKFLLRRYEQFLRGQDQTIACPTCPPVFSNREKPVVKRYDRRLYINHYRQIHAGDISFAGLAFTTGLSQRLMEAFMLYMMALTADYMVLSEEGNVDRNYNVATSPYHNIKTAVLGRESRTRIEATLPTASAKAEQYNPPPPGTERMETEMENAPLDKRSKSERKNQPKLVPKGPEADPPPK